MENKYLEKLEFNKIKEILSSYTITFLGKKMALELLPFNNRKEIEKALTQTFDASTLIYRKGNLPLTEINNITTHIKALKSYMTLHQKQLLDLYHILKISRELKEYFKNETEIDMNEFSSLEPLFTNLYSNPNIENSISKAIIDENTIADSASSTLSAIRKNIKNKENEIRNKLNSLLHSKFIQESIITVKNNRFVIPVKNEYRSEIKGFIHDISSSGSTVYIEPISVFELNNDISNLKTDENIEIEKILQKLSSLFYDIIPEIENNLNIIAILDFTFAKGKYSNDIDGIKPIINDKKYINLINVWHPLISKEHAVKNTISLGEDYTSLLITGPNTGGKTVTLKTTGLVILMAMCGLNIPAKENSSIYIFDNIFADIGDDQSILESLSTFSSHISNIANILNLATENSLVLIDELGAGTDPIQGANLAISILQELYDRNCLVLSTTHYQELKQFALITNGFENASVEFNLENLSPTYKLLIGVPGTSNAFAISRKLGISEKIISRAENLIKDDDIHIEDLLKSIYEDKRTIEIEKQKIENNSKEIEDLRNKLKTDYTDIKEKELSIINKAKNQARDILLSAKDDANEIIREIEKANNSKSANNLRNDLNDKINDLSIVSTKQEIVNKLEKKDITLGMQVFIPSLNQIGIINSLPNKSNSVQVQIGAMKMNFNIDKLEKTKQKEKTKNEKNYNKQHEFKVTSISSEINVIGYNVEDACFAIDKYLDSACMHGLGSIRIVHGKGTGILRSGIHKYLKTHPHVKNYRVGVYGEGEMGVTIVNLK
ncbi:MAG: endonuclease MutS2 [Clostridia bacterium]|nr:endonuclease MutS2 [Clostridia bacterium]